LANAKAVGLVPVEPASLTLKRGFSAILERVDA
jgi:hypothetical protein